jgi:hypothetical protein
MHFIVGDGYRRCGDGTTVHAMHSNFGVSKLHFAVGVSLVYTSTVLFYIVSVSVGVSFTRRRGAVSRAVLASWRRSQAQPLNHESRY